MSKKLSKLIFCLFLVVILLPFSAMLFTPTGIQNKNTDKTSLSDNQSADQLESSVVPDSIDVIEPNIDTEQLSSKFLNLNLDLNNDEIDEETSDSGLEYGSRSTRQATVQHIDTGSNDPNEGATQFSANHSILKGKIKGNEREWFYTSSVTSPPSGKIYNLTLSPDSLSNFGNEDWILVRIYVLWNFNEDYEEQAGDTYLIDDKELIILHQKSYNRYSSTHQNAWALATEKKDYYICIEGNPKNVDRELDYEIAALWYLQNIPTNDPYYGTEMNYNFQKARPITPWLPVKNKYINMNYQSIDWYSINAPTPPPGVEMLGLNVTVSVDIVSSSQSTPYSDGTATFVMELQVVILHLTKKGDLVFGNIGNASKHEKAINKHSVVPIGKDIRNFYSMHFYTTGKDSDTITKSYIGVFAVTYGIDLSTHEYIYYDGSLNDREEDTAMNGWMEYSFNLTNSEPIVRPSMTAKVYSLRTGTPYGRTYDKFRYHVFYSNPANYPPLDDRENDYKNTKLEIYIPLGGETEPIIGQLKALDPANTKYTRPPAEFIFTIDGNSLGEGDFRFQVICEDRHTYATGSKADKVFYDGPFITNNIPPVPRETAISNIIMYEDDKPMYLELDDIFEDVDNDPLFTQMIVDENRNKSSIHQTDSLRLRIHDNSRLEIEPITNKFGNNKIELEASDLHIPMINATHRLEITVMPVNDPPVIKTPFDKLFFFGEIRFDEDSSFSDLNLNDVFWDPIEFDPLDFFVSGNKKINVEISENGNVTLHGKANWSGTEELTFTARDPPGGAVSDVLKVVIEPVNDPPVFNETHTIYCYEETWTNITFEAWDPADGDPLIFSTDIALVINLKNEDYSFNIYTGELWLYPPNRVATPEVYTVTVTVRDQPITGDEDSLSASKQIDFIIRNTWDRPTCKILEPNNGDQFLHFEPIIFRGQCLDDDLNVAGLGEDITYEWHSDIDGKIGDRDIVRNVPLSAGGEGMEHVITLKVSDGKYKAYTSIKIFILRPNEKKDTDRDGMPDYWEDRNNLNKLNEDDAGDDSDQDGFTNLEEFKYGKDGAEGTNDPTDPWDPNDYPEGDFKDIVKKEAEEDYLMPMAIVIIIAIIIIVFLIVSYMLITRKVVDARRYSERKAELEKLKKKRDLEKQEEELAYGVYKSKKQSVLCHKCGHRNQIKSISRPLAVKCSQCDTRGVIY